MSLFDGYDLPVEDREHILNISQIYVFYYGVFMKKQGHNIKFSDSNKTLFKGNKHLFGRFVIQMFDLFSLEVNHPPFAEFKKFPTVADLITYIYEHTRRN